MGVKPLPGRIERVTRWQDHQGNVTQVAVAILEAEGWEQLCECVNAVGPFENVADVLAQTLDAAREWSAGLGVAERFPGL